MLEAAVTHEESSRDKAQTMVENVLREIDPPTDSMEILARDLVEGVLREVGEELAGEASTMVQGAFEEMELA